MWIATLAVLAVLIGVYVWMSFFQTYHLATVQRGVLYRTGFRTMREYETTISDVRPSTVVCLLDRSERARPPFSQEEIFCQHSRIGFVPIPVQLGGWPTQADVKAFVETVESKWRQPVLVHCAQGVRRTGMMVAAYQMSVLKWSKQKTKDAILTFGHSKRSIGDIERFIDGYDPVTYATVSGLPVGAE